MCLGKRLARNLFSRSLQKGADEANFVELRLHLVGFGRACIAFLFHWLQNLGMIDCLTGTRQIHDLWSRS